MSTNKHASHHSLKSDLVFVDAHRVKAREYDELPELTDDMLARATVNKGGQQAVSSSRAKRRAPPAV